MVLLLLAEMDQAMDLTNSIIHVVFMLMKIKLFMLLIAKIIVLWNGSVVQPVVK